ncbi:MAG TPA: LysR family transcriptional regulator [Rhizomicrobium sp.]|nr:LysR family transcriptional regulator [Rhizomicrobium sp.]
MAEPDWDDLRVLLAVGRTGKLSAAATKLRADHATVSRRISALEDVLQVKLLERRSTGVLLTEQGEKLMQAAEAMESLALSGVAEAKRSELHISGAVRIGAPEGFGSYFLAPRLGALCDRHPDLEIELVAMGAVFSLSKREADIAVGLTRPEQGRLYSRKLTDYRLGLYAAKDYFDTHPPVERVADLKQHRIIGYIEDLVFSSELANMFAQAGVPAPKLRSSNLIAQMQSTVAGAGLCMLPAFIAQGRAELRPVLASEIATRRAFWLTVHADLRDLARVRETCAFIEEEVRRGRELFL